MMARIVTKMANKTKKEALSEIKWAAQRVDTVQLIAMRLEERA